MSRAYVPAVATVKADCALKSCGARSPPPATEKPAGGGAPASIRSSRSLEQPAERRPHLSLETATGDSCDSQTVDMTGV